jgi:hypothetical protein
VKKLQTEDGRIIQKKIDGKLSPREEEQFYELIKISPEARRLFQRLSKLHERLEENSKSIPPIDLSEEIMQQINDRQKVQITGRTKTIRFMPAHSKRLLAYAAVLLLGLFVGGLATYLGTDGQRPGARDISGTMAKTPETGFYYNENGTKIDIRDFKANGFRAVLVSVSTRDSVYCTIEETQNESSDGYVKLLFSEGVFRKTETINLEERYLCYGKIVFLVDKNDNFKTPKVRFIKEGKVFCEFKPE